jgi:IS30 family transposase
LLSSARTGATLTEEERREIGFVLNAGLEHGQSVHHIMASRRDDFRVCEKSVYRYINSGLFLQRPGRMELPKAPGMKPRRKKGVGHRVDTKCRIDRTLEDYTAFLAAHPDNAVVEMDSVIGSRGGKVLLTFNFNNCTLMLAFLRDANTSQSVIDVFDYLEKLLGIDQFKTLFPVILTDNGTEFSNPETLETSCISGKRRTRIFYCDPYSSWQKGHVENNHENLRKIFPKGKSFDNFTQKDINLALSHLNSLARASLNDVPAIVLFDTIHGKEVLRILGITLVDKNAVYLTPMLLQK